MRKPTWGPVVKHRVRRFLEALLCCAHEFYESKDFQFRWEETHQKLVINTKRRCLEKVSNLDRTQIYEAIESLKILEILDDNRTQTQGTEDWHFTLKLWSKDPLKNLSQFDRAWENKRPERSKNQIQELADVVDKHHVFNQSIPITISLGYGDYSRKIPPRYQNQ